MDITEYKLGNLTIYDSPGLGDGKDSDLRHSRKIRELLRKKDVNGNAVIDLVLVIVDGSTKDLGTTYSLLEDIIIPQLGDDRSKRLLVAINQADVAMKNGKHWDYENCFPDDTLKAFLDEKVASIRNRLLQNTGVKVNPIYYCAGYKEEGGEQMPPYNLSKLLLYIFRALPPVKRLVLEEHVNPDKSLFEKSDNLEDYGGGIGDSLLECILEGVEEYGDLGEEIGGLLLGPAGKIGGRLMAVGVGLLRGLINYLSL